MHRMKLIACAVGVTMFAANVLAQQDPPTRGKDAPQDTLTGYTNILSVDIDSDGDSSFDGTATYSPTPTNPITGGPNNPYTGNAFDPNTGTGYVTQPGWTPWLLFDGNAPAGVWKDNAALQNGVVDRVFSTAAGDVYVVLDTLGYTGDPEVSGFVMNARGRDAEIDTDDDGIPDTIVPSPSSGGVSEEYLDGVYHDFVFVPRNELWGMGRAWLKVEIDVSDVLADDVLGYGANTGFELSMYAFDPNSGSTFGFQAWAQAETLGGLDPSAWLDANWKPNADNPATTDVDESTVTPVRGYEVMYFGGDRSDRKDGYRDEFGAFPGTYRNPMLDGVDTDGIPTVLGDTDGDGDVDGVDLANVKDNFGVNAVGDADNDSDTDIDDLVAVKNNFGDVGFEALNPELTQGDPNTGVGIFRTPVSGPWPVTDMTSTTWTLDGDNDWSGDLDGDDTIDRLDEDADGDSIDDRDANNNLTDDDSDNDGWPDGDVNGNGQIDIGNNDEVPEAGEEDPPTGAGLHDGYPGFYNPGNGGDPFTGNPDPTNHDPDNDANVDPTYTQLYDTSPWRYALISNFTPDEDGVITLYTWTDGQTFNNVAQLATILNGFQVSVYDATPPGLGFVPEPTSVTTLLALGGVTLLKRRKSLKLRSFSDRERFSVVYYE